MAKDKVTEVEVLDPTNGNESEEEARLEKAVKGAMATLDDLREEDGEIAKAASRLGQQGSSVLHRSMTAVEDKDYRQILLTGMTDLRAARLAVAAIAERQRYGVPITDIIDRIHAEASVTMGNRILSIFRTITNTTFTTNYSGKNKFGFGRKQSNDNDHDRGSEVTNN